MTYNLLLSRLSTKSLNALLDGNDRKCARISALMEKALKCALGKECPHCGSKEVAAGGDQAECLKCNEVFDIGGGGTIT